MIAVIKMLVAGLLKHPVVASHVVTLKKRVFKEVGDLTVDAYSTAEPIPFAEVGSISPERMRKGAIWTEERFGACWFHLTGVVPSAADGKHLVALVKLQGEGLSYEDEETGDLVTSILSVPDVLQPPTIGKCVVELTPKATAGAMVDAWIDAGYNGINGNFLMKAKFRYAKMAVRRESLWDYYYDYVTLAVLLATDGHNPLLTPALKEKLLWVLSQSYALYDNGQLDGAHKILRDYYDLPQAQDGVEYTLVGHAHLDLAWMWPKRESMRKAVRTFTNAVRQIEHEPAYVFGASQAQMFDWVRQSTPTLFAKLQRAVASGNIELQGGMWVECDCNMPSGESLIRQFGYGDAFFLEHFGRTSDVVWLPDAFGFSYALPTIAAGCGKKYFVTTKLTWNRHVKFPYQTFYWKGLDGATLLSHVSPEGTYCNDGTPLAWAKAEERNTQKELGAALVIYGVGDGGGGAGEGHIQIAKRAIGLAGAPKARFGSAASCFERLAERKDVPTFDGELYLEYHRGVLSSQAEEKRLNRLAERNLHVLEWLLAYDGRSADVTHDLWRVTLFNQFHDILPGSGIGRVHRESVAELTEVVDRAAELYAGLLPTGEGFGWLNPSPFARREYQTAGGKTYLVSAEGYASASFAPVEKGSVAGDDYLENDFVKVTFARGVVTSYLDKRTGKEYAKAGLNVLGLYYDKDKRYDAWNIGLDYLSHPRTIRFSSQRAYMDGATAVMELRFALPHGTIVQAVRLGYGTQVAFDTTVEWHEEHLMLRADFVPTVYARWADCDIQFGSVARDTADDTPEAAAQIEVCAHKYVSVEDAGCVFALYSDSKYGYRLKKGVLSIDLLRSPKYPDPECDMGVHRFAYAMDIPATRMDAVRGGYNFNYPLLALPTAEAVAPLATVDTANVVLETIKPAAMGEGYVLRLYERLGVATDCTLALRRPYLALYTTDLLEKNPVETNARLHFAPHEIKTILVKTG